jgi:hypothetical protein
MEEHKFKVGDSVAVLNSHGCLSSVQRVVRLTKTQVVLDNNIKYRKDGEGYGDHWAYRGNIELATEHHFRILEKRDLLNRIDQTKMANLNVETLKKIVAILDAVAPATS